MLRQRGYSTWILKGAILEPKVFIVCANGQNRKWLSDKYYQMCHDVSVEEMRLEGRASILFSTEWPKFITMNEIEQNIRGRDQHIPVIFDNSCFYV